MRDMDALAKYYVQHVGKVVFMGALVNSAIQFALSFMDDDDEDEHGQVGRGNPDAKKRFMLNNEPGKRFAIRTPWRDRNQKRIYLNLQFLRESTHIGQLVVQPFLDKYENSFGKTSLNWFVNRLNTGVTWLVSGLFGMDLRTGEKFKSSTAAARYFSKQIMPLGFREEDVEATGVPEVDKKLWLLGLFGTAKRSGMPIESGVTWREAADNQKLADDYEAAKDLFTDNFANKDDSEIKDLIGPYFSRESAKALFNRRERPATKFSRDHKRAIAIQKMMMQKRKEAP